MPVKIGYNSGECSECGKTIYRKVPIDYAVCDCYLYCPDGHKMQPYMPDMNPRTYGPITSDKATGDTEHPMEILFYCSVCKYYSALQPVEVQLS